MLRSLKKGAMVPIIEPLFLSRVQNYGQNGNNPLKNIPAFPDDPNDMVQMNVKGRKAI